MLENNNPQKSEYTIAEEIINSLTHGVGALFSIIGLIVLIINAYTRGTTRHIVSYSIFGGSLILLYLASTLYHSVTNQKIKLFFKKLDHSAIFILIAATYTPFMLNHVGGVAGLCVFIAVWFLAIVGIVMKVIFISKFEKLSLLIYLGMGWLCVVIAKQMFYQIPLNSLILLAFGGLSYTFGVIFYLWQKLPFNHGIWHVFVLTGSTLHFLSVTYST